ncbi:TPA: glyoxylate carboligase [Escherichia coli]|uniref:glyoxylate carboligase n=1 Tax=Escherichia coli TaxID=562 RepID=UPI000DDFA89E|nr:glyoxylate carboligase [Escherichia coli]EFA8831676.1 glyoxylate carboligase [Escherichia coli O1:H7]HAH1266309.1 glyoxylate carboligase [Escherichia coli]HAJ7626412.1 glyoxylate carboligase [Escherichia coli]HBE3065717.1 glyoxylate carboligase [Escherichia coli]HBE3131564.1 glyoxylate carboligase [Escherichia coli]
MAKMRAVDAAMYVLEKEGITTAFGVPGAAINPFYSAMRKHGGIRHILARHVEGASHMAEGYTRATAGNIGVCLGTSGPAGTDMITALYSASADSIPILCITGQAPRARLHKEDFQAVDIEAIAKPVSKMAVTVREAALVPRVLQQAFHLMRSGRPGPVLVDLPFDVQVAEIEFDPDMYEPLPVYKPAASRMQIEKAVEMLIQAERPVIVAGGGVINADAAALLQQFAELTSVPVIPTLMGWGCIPDDHELMAGMVGLQTAHRYGNATLLVEVAQEMQKAGRLPCRKEWVADCQQRKRTLLRKTHFDNVPVKPQRVYEEMNKAFGRDVCYVTTIGLSQIAAAQMLHVFKDRHWINCGQAGPLGWTIPAALGVCAADPERNVVAISGDFDFQFLIEELAVGAQFNIPYIHVLVNNAYLGLIRQSQRAFDMDYCVQLAFENINSSEVNGYGVDHVKVAEGLGCKAIRVFKPEDIAPAFEQAKILMAQYRVPVVVEVILERVTNISMGSELDNVMEFEDIADNAADAPTETCFMHYE